MSPRAACRLETLGFGDVHDYVAGKMDWIAAALPTEGTKADVARIVNRVRTDVPTCGLDHRVGDVATRVKNTGWEYCAVIASDKTVLGRIRRAALDDPANSDRRIEDVMEPGPTTTRADTDPDALIARMRPKRVTTQIVTTPEGRLIGLFQLDDND